MTDNGITHVIFDLDGTMLATEDVSERIVKEISGKYGKEYTMKEKVQVMGKIPVDSARKVISLLDLPISLEDYQKKTRELEEKYMGAVPLMPGVAKLVKYLHERKIPMCVATSSDDALYALKSKAYPEIFSCFHHVVTSDNPGVKNGKPAPDTFLVAAAGFDPPPTSSACCLVIEDSVNGVQAALAAQMSCVMVPDPRLDRSNLAAKHVLDSLVDFNPAAFGL